jgi:hypothetical protein
MSTQIQTGQLLPSALSEATLQQFNVAYPSIHAHMFRLLADEEQLFLLKYTLGEAVVNNADIFKSRGLSMNTVSRNYLEWARMGRYRQTVDTTAAPSGTGLNNVPITIQFAQNWLSPGMTVVYEDGAGGSTSLLIQTGPTASGGNYNYTAVVVGPTTATLNPAISGPGTQAAWQGGAMAAYSQQTANVPVLYPDLFQNYTTTWTFSQTVTGVGATTPVWFNMEGSDFYITEEERQLRVQALKSLEGQGWTGNSTMLTGTSNVTDPQGNTVTTGSGVWEQIITGNFYTYNIAAAFAPATNQAFYDFMSDTISSWAVVNAISADNIYLDMILGTKSYQLMTQTIQRYQNSIGNWPVQLFNRDKDDMGIKGGTIPTEYEFGGFHIKFHKNAQWDDLGMNAYKYNGTLVPKTSYQILVMPEKLVTGGAPIQLFMRSDNDVNLGWIFKYNPGLVDPNNANSMYANNAGRGYQMYISTEYMFIVPDPSKLLRFYGV